MKDVYPKVETWIETACAGTCGRYEAGDIYDALLDRRMQLWVSVRDGIIEACCVTEIVCYPRSKWAAIVIGTGHRRHNWQHFAADIERWAASKGCRGVQSVARTGWAKVFKAFGYEQSHVFLEKDGI